MVRGEIQSEVVESSRMTLSEDLREQLSYDVSGEIALDMHTLSRDRRWMSLTKLVESVQKAESDRIMLGPNDPSHEDIVRTRGVLTGLHMVLDLAQIIQSVVQDHLDQEPEGDNEERSFLDA